MSNSRSCNKGFKLFGVQIDVGNNADGGNESSSIRRTKSLGNLNVRKGESKGIETSGYISDGLFHQSTKIHERRKGSPWTEDEHRLFLAGLEKLGKGDWKGISRNFVQTRNSTQIASHAQKYFIRIASEKKVRRSSIFDIPGSSNRDAAESSQHASSTVVDKKQIGEVKGQESIQAPVMTPERPPLSPVTRREIPDLRNKAYMQIVPSYNQAFPASTVRPTVSWVPVMNFSSHNGVFLPGFHGNLANYANFVPPRSTVTLKESIQTGLSQTQATKNDELSLNICNLAL
ncbi:hypothetical protein ACJIZ3_009425 [Penstemon smallii]|uniref:Uncharacterized protein n=1 Tax=Penstemon smallii TaxID=265156 RepID=A0ABD3TCI4_9LAMI